MEASGKRHRVREHTRAASQGVRIRIQIDWEKTLENYEQRIRSYPVCFFAPLNNAYVSDYLHARNKEHISILLGVCQSKKIHILGCVPENQKNGTHAYLPPDFPEDSKIIYVGQSNHITNRKESPFSVLKSDVAYLTDK